MKTLLVRTWLVLMLAVLGATAAYAVTQTYRLRIDGLACPFCAYGIEKQLSRIEGVKTVDTDIRGGMVTLTMTDGATLDEATARRAVEAAGFTLRGFEPVQASAKE